VSLYRRILVPIDGSSTAQLGLAEAVKLAQLTGGAIRLLHVVDELSVALSAASFAACAADVFDLLREGGQSILDAARAFVEQAGVAVDTELRDNVEGRLADLVIASASAWNADLIVIGTHGRRGVERMVIGSDAEQIARYAPVPVLLVRANATTARG
jgi:nucleotide-binding universal stress UspA family protein